MILFLSNNKEISWPLFQWLKKRENIIYYSEKLNLNFLGNIDFIISYNYKYIISEDILKFVNYKAINLHISLLPYNRGAMPNFWSFMDNTPKGYTIHQISKGLDTGKIILQKELYLHDSLSTLKTSYNALHFGIQNSLKQYWNYIREFNIELKTQKGKGSYHNLKDFEKIKENLKYIDYYNISITELKKIVSEM